MNDPGTFMFRKTDKVFLITGGSQVITKAFAEYER